jgi:hypothetical protein
MNSITYFQLLSTYNEPYLIALRATRTRHPIEGGVFVLIWLDSREKMVTMKFM